MIAYAIMRMCVKLESKVCAFLTSIFTFNFFINKQLVVLLVKHTTLTANKKKKH